MPIVGVPSRDERTTSHTLPSSQATNSSSTDVGGGHYQHTVASRRIT
jgi:hypothetical protein